MYNRDEANEPSKIEVELSRIFALIDEIKTGNLNKKYWNGFDPRAYCNINQRALLPETKERLFRIIKGIDIKEYSLELQIWARDNQK